MLIESKADINIQNDKGETPIHTEASMGNLKVVDLLLKHGANTAIKSNENCTAQESAIINGHDEVAKIISNSSEEKIDINAYRTKRRLYYVLGGNKLDNKMISSQLDRAQSLHIDTGGGGSLEGYITLIMYLTRYIDFKKKAEEKKSTPNGADHIKKLEQALFHLQSTTENFKLTAAELAKKLQQLKPGEKEIINVGYWKHLMGGALKKENEDRYVFTLLERSGNYNSQFMGSPFIPSDKIHNVLSIHIPKNDLEWFIKKLEQARASDVQKAGEILFTEIPERVGGQYLQNTNIGQARSTAPLCFWVQPKSVVRHDLDELDPMMGKELYKEFTLFMREQAVKDYGEIVGKDKFFEAGEEIIASKKNKIQN